MGEYFTGKIQIGGPVSRCLARELAQAIVDAGALPEAELSPATLQTMDDLLASVDPSTHVIRLYDNQASYGRFSSLETWLQSHGIAYDRQSDAWYEFDGQAVSFRPNIGLVENTATQTGTATVPIDLIRPVRDLLRAALIEPTTDRVAAALDALEATCSLDVPPLAPFHLVD